MTGKDYIENKLEKLGSSISPDRDLVKKVMTRIESAPLPTTQPASIHQMWRIILKSRMTKLAAAAVIVLAIVGVVNYFGGSPDGASDAFAEIEEAVKKVPWMHCVFSQADTVVLETWNCFGTGSEIEKESGGAVTFWDYEKHKKYKFNPTTETITVGSLPECGRTLESGKPLVLFKKLIHAAKNKGAKLKRRKGYYDGKRVETYEVTQNKGLKVVEKSELKVDIETHLPIILDVESRDDTGKVMFAIHGQFDYPKTCPENVYELGVPRSARIIDETR